MKRQIIEINEDKCNGCGLCIPNCHEGALQLIDGKARLISDLFCDGLGACLGHCPEGAITMVEREAEPYSEILVMQEMVKKGRNTVLAHLEHLKAHGEEDLLAQAIGFLKDNKIDMSPDAAPHTRLTGPRPLSSPAHVHGGGGCPGMAMHDFRVSMPGADASQKDHAGGPSELRQWPVQLHLLNPQAGYFKNADVVLAADCVAFTMGDFHNRYLRGKTLAIACPKLDANKESYVAKLASMVSESKINTLTVVMMEVPCCQGLLQMAQLAVRQSGRQIPVKKAVVSIKGDIIMEEWT
jgi:Pyruvate/2-oxoacid:ferredoxin oxidoreductase delta subunit